MSIRFGFAYSASVEGAGDPIGLVGLSVERVLGTGASSTVYLASQPKFARRVAVKVLNAVGTDATARKLFVTECHTLGRLTAHPDVVTLFDSGFTTDGRPYLVMEYLEGGTLAGQIAAKGSLSAAEVMSIGVRLAGALESAHRFGVVHGDVKPQNVLWRSTDVPALADFGIARLIAGASTSRLAAISPLHAAPELLDGQPPSAATDVYGLASTLFELLDGRPAAGTAQDSPIQVVGRIGRQERRHLDPDGLPAGLAELIEAAMAFDPADRPGSAAEVGRGLMAIQASAGMAVSDMTVLEPSEGAQPPFDGGAAADGATLPPRGPTAWRRRRWLLVGLVALVVGGSVGIVLKTLGGPAAAPASTTTTTEQAEAIPPNSGPTEIKVTIPGQENLSPALASDMSDIPAIFAPVGRVTADSLPVGSGSFQTPMSLRYVAINPTKAAGCAGFITRRAVVNGIWQRYIDFANSSRVEMTVIIFDSVAAARESFLVFSLQQSPKPEECRGFKRSYGVIDPDRASIVHRDPPLVLSPPSARYNAFTLGPPPDRTDLTTVIGTVVQNGRSLIIMGLGSPSAAGPPTATEVSAALNNILSRISS